MWEISVVIWLACLVHVRVIKTVNLRLVQLVQLVLTCLGTLVCNISLTMRAAGGGCHIPSGSK